MDRFQDLIRQILFKIQGLPKSEAPTPDFEETFASNTEKCTLSTFHDLHHPVLCVQTCRLTLIAFKYLIEFGEVVKSSTLLSCQLVNNELFTKVKTVSNELVACLSRNSWI